MCLRMANPIINRVGRGGVDVLEYIDVAAAIGFDPCKLIRLLRK